MRITALAGGIGGARFLRGLLPRPRRAPPATTHEVTVIGNTARRHHPARPAGLPRPRHRDVHPRRRRPRGAGLGPRRRDVHRRRGARGVRRRAAVVHPRRPRRRHPRRPHPDARPRVHPVAGHRGAVRALAAGRAAAADDATTRSRPTSSSTDADAEGGERAVHFQEWWVRLHAAVPAAADRRRRRRPGQARARRARGDPRTPTSSCCRRATRWSRSAPSCRCPGVRDAMRGTRAPVVGVSPIIGGAPVRGMADACLTRDRRGDLGRRPSPGCTRTSSTAGWWPSADAGPGRAARRPGAWRGRC